MKKIFIFAMMTFAALAAEAYESICSASSTCTLNLGYFMLNDCTDNYIPTITLSEFDIFSTPVYYFYDGENTTPWTVVTFEDGSSALMTTTIPEPSTVAAILGLGALGFAAFCRRRRAK